ncbi:MAG: SDR family NAD(P)-dependent oxidoreductase [Candidatus Thorarchaeota archaeon]|jgi:UDP-glucose 4-epimerase
MDRVLVTGGAGFIGSHLVDRLVKEYSVVVLDDVSEGTIENIKPHMESSNFTFIEGSITSEEDVRLALEGVTKVFHLAAQADVRLSVSEPMEDFTINMIGGMTLLEGLRKQDVGSIVFASSGGTVYGDSSVFPTPEETRLAPISNYGAAKCAFEMYLSSYAELYGMNAVSMRLANIIGPRLSHGIIIDLYKKLKKDPTKLEVLGTGRQEKAYMHVSDVVGAAFILSENMRRGHLAVNVSSGERLTVSRIAELVCEGLGVPEARLEYTGSKRGWTGDVVITDLDITFLKSIGWTPKIRLEDGVRQYLDWLIESFGPVLGAAEE